MTKSDSKEALLQEAKKIFARSGYDGATVKEIADAAGMNISMVSYHFDGKENLFRACVEEFAHSRLASTEKFLKGPDSLEDMRVRLNLLIEEFFDYNLQEPHINEIMLRDCSAKNPITHDLYMNVFSKAFDNLVAFFRRAQKKGLLAKDIETEDRVRFFIGGMVHTVRTDPMHEELHGASLKQKFYRERLARSLVRMALEGAIP